MCLAEVPLKKPPTGQPRCYNTLRRKKAKLKKRLAAARLGLDSNRIRELEDQIALICFDIKDAIVNRLDSREKSAVQKIKTNAKYFFSYAKSFSKVQSNISMLSDKDGVITTDKRKIVDTLQDQFCSVFSKPDAPGVLPPEFPVPDISSPDPDITVTEDDIKEAISEISPDSAAGPDGIPAILLKNCADILCVPLQLLWSESMETGCVPSFYKVGYVTPLFKKGSRAEPGNYRPVTLTSHVIKIFERVVRKNMMGYPETNNIISGNQHGFRPGRSCSSQMISHFDKIFKGLTENHDTDMPAYLDFSKAFDKVDIKMLIKKLQRYGFNQKLINWILDRVVPS